MKNLSEENIEAFVDYIHFKDINLKVRFDRLCSNVYYKYLNKSTQNKVLFELQGGRVKSFEDLYMVKEQRREVSALYQW